MWGDKGEMCGETMVRCVESDHRFVTFICGYANEGYSKWLTSEICACVGDKGGAVLLHM